MPGALPTTRPTFLDEELRNGNYATPVLMRKMIDWCRFTYARDLPYWPCDPLGSRISHLNDADSSGTAKTYDLAMGSGFWRQFGSFYVPAPLSPSSRLKVSVWTATSDFTQEILLTSNRGLSSTLTLSGPHGDAWQDFTIPAAPDSVVTIQARAVDRLEDGALYGFCAWWEEPSSIMTGASVDTTGIPLPSQAFPAQDRPASLLLLRALGRWMNRFTARGVRQVAAKWYPPACLVTTGAVSLRVIARYKVWISDKAKTITFRWIPTSTGGTATLRIDAMVAGVTLGTALIDSATMTATLTPGAAYAEEFVVYGNCTVATNVWLSSFTAEEDVIDTAAIPLPSGESFPVAMPTLAKDSIRTEAIIKATGTTGLTDILQALLYLVKTRKRTLIKDCGLVQDRETGGIAGGSGALGRVAIFALSVTAPRKIVFRGGLHGRMAGSTLPASARADAYTALFAGFGDGHTFTTSAPKASIDSVEAANASVKPADGTKVVEWPDWVVRELGRGAMDYTDAIRLIVNQTDGLYEAEWTGTCIEEFIPEVDVP